MEAPFDRVVMFSGGEGSFRAAKIERFRYPSARLGLVFTDTLYEDADTYRFLLDAACNVFDRSASWVPSASAFPDYRVHEETRIEEYAGNPEWRQFLAALRATARENIPELVWLVEGRDPWEIFRDCRFLGNSSVDPCSKVAKRLVADAWRVASCRRQGELFGSATKIAVGIGDHEPHRFDDGVGGGIGPRTAADGWIYHAPLLTDPDDCPALFAAPVERLGVRPQRLYVKGYRHANCGGFCCKAGHAHYANRFRVDPERFAYDASMERKLREFLDSDVSMLTDRKGGFGKRPLTLDEFAARLRDDPKMKFENRPGESGCGCFGVVA